MNVLGDFLVWLIGFVPIPSRMYSRTIKRIGADIRFTDNGALEVYDLESGETYYSEQIYAKSP